MRIPAAFAHATTWVPMLVVLAIGIVAVLWMWRLAKTVLRAVEQNDATLDQRLTESQERAGSERPLSERVVGALGNLLEREPGGKRWIVYGSRVDLYEAYGRGCDEELRGYSPVERLLMAMGHSLTGIALLLTFGLIAWVLAAEIPAAIQGVAQTGNSQASQSGTDALQRAVGLMGAKFAVSALGLLLSLLFSLGFEFRRRRIAAAGEASLRRHRDLFVLAEDYRVEQLRSDLGRAQEGMGGLVQAQTAALTERLDGLAGIEPSVRQVGQELHVRLTGLAEVMQAEVARALEALNAQGTAITSRLDQLASIEVSVKDMGNEVRTHLGLLMKQHVADQICDAVADLRVFADQIAQRLEASLTESFTRLAAETIAQLGAALRSIRESIEGRAGSDVERLIEQMRDMMSGGFQAESQQMTQAMASLRDVLPRLEGQLRAITTDVERQMRERGEEQQRLQAELVRQVEGVVSANERSRVGLEALIDRISRYAEESTQQLQGRLAESGEKAVNSLIAGSAEGLRELRLQLGQVNEIATVNVGTFSREVGAAAEHLAGVRRSLEDGLASLRAMAVELNGGLAGARDGLAAAERAGGLFSAAGESISDATRLTEATVSSLGDRLRQEAGVIEAHRALAGQVEKQVMPVLERVFAGHAEAIEEQSRRLQAAWQQLAERVKQTVEACGAGLQDSVEQLAEQVSVLQRQLDRAQGRAGR